MSIALVTSSVGTRSSIGLGRRRYSGPSRIARPGASGVLRGARSLAVGGRSIWRLAEVLGMGTPRAPRDDSLVLTAAAAPDRMTVAVTGATGLVGSRLVAKLSSQGHSVRVLTRNVNGAKAKLPYRGLSFHAPSDWENAVHGCTGVVNLAGEPIATRWTPELKRQIKSSRVDATRAVVGAINSCPEEERPEVLVSASAVGFYGVSETQTFNEESPSGSDYLAEVCKAWEAEANSAQVRTVILRIGVVLAADGGALAKMLPVFSLFAGGPLGSGQQWFSWVHRDDLVALVIEALSNKEMAGVYNGTAPKPVRMSEMCSALGGVMGRPSWLPVPEFALKTLLGEGASVVLDGQKVLPSKAQSQGFSFQYADIGAALRNIYMRL